MRRDFTRLKIFIGKIRLIYYDCISLGEKINKFIVMLYVVA